MPTLRARVPIDGIGTDKMPFHPRYSRDGGVEFGVISEYNHDDGYVDVEFTASYEILALIAAEDDVTVIEGPQALP